MKYDIEKEQSFLGLFRTQKCWPDLKKMLEEWRENLAEPYRSKPFIEWDIIVFNIKDRKLGIMCIKTWYVHMHADGLRKGF